MSGQEAAQAAVGFLTVVRSDVSGLLGGYLVLNAGGRPLEFHCTAPIRPNRAQEILYGATLEPFLYGEQIGQTLVAAAKTNVPLVCTDLPQVMAASELVSQPLALLLEEEPSAEQPADSSSDRAASSLQRVDGRHGLVRPLSRFQVGRHHLALAAAREADRPSVTTAIESLGDSFDLAEPFTRIRDAILEAQRGV